MVESQLIAFTLAVTLAASLAASNLINYQSSIQSIPNEKPTDSILFSKWKAKYGINYLTPSENAFRMATFKSNLAKIQGFRKINPEATYDLNVFADRTKQELLQWDYQEDDKIILERKTSIHSRSDYQRVIDDFNSTI